ncbi:MAG: hypothetical protein RLZ47_160 [Bacteroidota bacterium]|jgi:hypothetical protein
MKYFLLIFFLCFLSTHLYAQTDSTQNNSLLQELNASTADQEKLLPNKMMITQRMLWGEKGLMRKFNRFELTPEKRQNELKLRRTALAAHQVLGFATLGGMLAQGIVGSRLYNGDYNLKDTHEALGAAVNFTYFTTASLSLFAPPKLIDERKGYSSIKVHKWLAVVHMSAMIATNVLANRIEDRPELKPYHRAAAYTAFGAFAASMLIIKF